MGKLRFVFQNMTQFCLFWFSITFYCSCFYHIFYPIRVPERLPECDYECRFFRGKVEFRLNTSGSYPVTFPFQCRFIFNELRTQTGLLSWEPSFHPLCSRRAHSPVSSFIGFFSFAGTPLPTAMSFQKS